MKEGNLGGAQKINGPMDEITDLLKCPPKAHVLKVWSPADVMVPAGPGGRKLIPCGHSLDVAIGSQSFLPSLCFLASSRQAASPCHVLSYRRSEGSSVK